MRDRIGAAFILAATVAMSVMVATPQPAGAAGSKVAVIVGPAGTLTNMYRSMANEVVAVATAAGATVATAYSPSATWPAVKAAVDGANVIVYLGHGSGYPNPYGTTELTDRSNGWGLNTATTNGDADSWSAGTLVYCGERALLGTLTLGDDVARRTYCGGTANDGISPAAGFTMVYAQAHYAPGFGERYSSSTPPTTLADAQQHVRHYSAPILALGGTFLATGYGDADEIVGRVLTQGTTGYGQIFAAGGGYSPSTLTKMAHPDRAGAEVWVQQTVISSLHFGQPDFWYAFAGDPNRTPGSTVAPAPTPAPAPAPVPGSPTMQRLAGADRFATAAAVSAASFATGVPVAYAATGADFPDALAAGAAAAERGGPVLLVTAAGVPPATAAELSRLKPAVIKLIGGAGVVSDGVMATLSGYATSGTAQRVAGANRFATAAALSADTFGSGAPVAYIATGANFPDALAGVAAAAVGGGPILLTAPGELASETAVELTRLRPGRIVVLGGTGVVSDAVAAALVGYATSGSVTRLAGPDRYATAVAISAATFASSSTVFIATGANFPDALGGGPVAGSLPAPLLLVNAASLPSSVTAELQRLDPGRVVILGGGGAVSDAVVSQIGSLLGG